MKAQKAHNIAEHLFESPEVFNFFQAVRLLDNINYEKTKYKPHWKQFPVGYDVAQQKETVRFKVDPALKYPAGAITKLTEPEISPAENRLKPAQMSVTFMGLTGPSGVLPMHYSEQMLEQIRNKDFAMRDFFDLFNHRAVSLHYRGWEKYRIQYRFERQRRNGNKTDILTRILQNISGVGTHSNAVQNDSLLYYSGLLANPKRSAIGLQNILSDYFKVPVKIQQFIGSWNRLQDSECTRMPNAEKPNGQFNRLNRNIVLGKRVWYSQGKFRIIVGPLSQKEFKQFLPGSEGLKKLKALTDAYIGPELSYDIQLVSASQQIPLCQLNNSTPPRLGYFTWLRGDKATKLQHDKLILV